jgi:hypothetical protein
MVEEATYDRNIVIVFYRQKIYNEDYWFTKTCANMSKAKEFIKKLHSTWITYKIVRLN